MQKLNYDDVLFMTTSDLTPVGICSEASCVDHSCLLHFLLSIDIISTLNKTNYL